MAELSSFDFSSEDLFVATAYVIDDIAEEPMDAPAYIDGLWDELKIELKRLHKPAPPQEDLNTVCSVLLCVVAAAFRLQWSEHYSETLFGLLRDNIHTNGRPVYEEDLDETINRICEYAEALEDWINDYTSCSIEWLSQTIDAVIAGSGKVIPLNVFQPTGQTFTKTPLMIEREVVIICKYLTQKEKLDAQASPDDFCKLFSGVDSEFKITWLGKEGELRDLFKTLVGEGDKECYITPRKGYQQILRSHFKDKNGNDFVNLKGAKSIASFAPVIDNVVLMLKHNIDKCVEEMRKLIEESREPLEDAGYFEDYHPTEDLHVTKRKGYTEE